MGVQRLLPYLILLSLVAVVFQQGFLQKSLLPGISCPESSSSFSPKSIVSDNASPSNEDAAKSLTVPLKTTPESCQRSVDFPGQIPNYFVCPHQQPQCPIERHLYFVHGKSGSTTTDRLVMRHCPVHGERVNPQVVLNTLRNLPNSFPQKQKTVSVQAEGVIPYRYFAEKHQVIGNCYASMLMMRDPWTRYQSDYSYRAGNERGRTDLYVHNNDSMESFFQRYPNYVTATLGDSKLHEHCSRHAKKTDYAMACWFQEVRYRGPEILQHVLTNLRRDFTTVGLMEDFAGSMVLFQHAVGKDDKFCNQTGFLEMASFRKANAHKHKELSRNSTEYLKYRKYFWLDELLYEAVTALYQEQLQMARQIPELAAQLDALLVDSER